MCLLLVVDCCLSFVASAAYSVFLVACLLLVVGCLLCVVCLLSLFVSVVCSVLRVVCFSLRADCCLLVYDAWYELPFVVCGLSLWCLWCLCAFVAGCSLLAVRRLMFVVSRRSCVVCRVLFVFLCVM